MVKLTMEVLLCSLCYHTEAAPSGIMSEQHASSGYGIGGVGDSFTMYNTLCTMLPSLLVLQVSCFCFVLIATVTATFALMWSILQLIEPPCCWNVLYRNIRIKPLDPLPT